ncbi:hypothetical protein NLG07_10135 [Alteromonas sp. LMIT006]|uniref:hypothetical protein n=1 Tax=Alteromonadaceae TaxID=72275 RepID=UPI0020CA535B|nr:hypothetical protein [Alteromonas sp. LMIT006]UTP72335.1 hypothetical protein NLG07_10110 [Alteromonas sp. LMIT006]UTP72340.1 hypothetical protein NLG07_10135 [Alteromonas sp. LMIT006]
MLRTAIIVLLFSNLLGCAAALVPYTSDPKQKISDAYWLFDQNERPLPAEKLIIEAIDIYQTENDRVGLAEAYKAYAIFLRSSSVELYLSRYIENGFNNSTIKYEDRFDASIKFLDKSAMIYEELERYDDLTNIYLHRGYTYIANDQVFLACASFNKSLEMNKKFIALKPDAKIVLDVFSSYEEYIDNVKQRAKCDSV